MLSEFWKSPRQQDQYPKDSVIEHKFHRMLSNTSFGQVNLGKVELIKFKLLKKKKNIQQASRHWKSSCVPWSLS